VDSTVRTAQRFGITIGLRPERRADYLALHAAVWPEVEATLIAANIRNFSIFIRDDVLFGYYEYVGDDLDADQALIAADPATQRWWALTDPCQQRLPGIEDHRQWAPMTEVWHLGA
jgi:L-rhamnose mutarotase